MVAAEDRPARAQIGLAAEGLVVGGRYQLERQLGAGGFGQVWQAWDTELDVDVAIKQVLLGPAMSGPEQAERVIRAQREARAAARLRGHPNVVAVYDTVVDGGVPWMVMELVAGVSMADFVQERGPLVVDHAAKVAAGMLAALGAAHAAGIVHRDVKPANIMLTGGGRALLTDFGIAVRRDDTVLTAAGVFIGSFEYAPPERLRGQDAGPAGDLYALGVSLYYAVQGISPFRRGSAEGSMQAVLFENVAEPALAGRLAPLIRGLMVKDPSSRLTVDQATALLKASSKSARAARSSAPTRQDTVQPASIHSAPTMLDPAAAASSKQRPAQVPAEKAQATGSPAPQPALLPIKRSIGRALGPPIVILMVLLGSLPLPGMHFVDEQTASTLQLLSSPHARLLHFGPDWTQTVVLAIGAVLELIAFAVRAPGSSKAWRNLGYFSGITAFAVAVRTFKGVSGSRWTDLEVGPWLLLAGLAAALLAFAWRDGGSRLLK
jgi:serine/threonine protein kinase